MRFFHCKNKGRLPRLRRLLESALLPVLLPVLLLIAPALPSAEASLAPRAQREIIVGGNGGIGTIGEALRVAANGDTILIRGGSYKEGNLVVDKSVTIVGEASPRVDGGNNSGIFTVTADGVVIKGLVLQNAGTSFMHDNAAIKIDGAKNCRIENNRFVDDFFAIYLAKASGCVVTGNEITGNARTETGSGNGIHLWHCRDARVSGNNVTGQRDGIYLEFSNNIVIEGNRSEKNLRYGLHFMFSNGCRYLNNAFVDNGAGVAVMYSKDVEMSGNRFEGNWGPASYGLLLKDIQRSRITGNYLHKNTIGIYAESASRLEVAENTFERNGVAVKLLASSANMKFTRNNFLGNSFDVATNTSQGANNNDFDSNYWDNYQGYDLDRDGTGNVPFRPVRLFSMVITEYPPALILLRSLFVEVVDLAERAFPALTPESLVDRKPLMRRVL